MTTITILDGGMGQELVRRSDQKPTGLWSCQIMIDRPDLVRSVHDDFFAAGAHVATTNSYAIHRDRLRPAGIEDKFETLHQLACDIACRARDAHGSGLVAGSIGPLGWSYSHDGAPDEERSAELYHEVCRLQADHVDALLIETIASIEQARAALRGAQGHGKPVWLALTVTDIDTIAHTATLRSGETLAAAIAEIEQYAVDAILLNCSVPEAVTRGLPVLADKGVAIGGYANGFTQISPEFLTKGSVVTKLSKRIELTPAVYADHVDDWIRMGATLVGGCCEVGPEHIRALAERNKPGLDRLAG